MRYICVNNNEVLSEEVQDVEFNSSVTFAEAPETLEVDGKEYIRLNGQEGEKVHAYSSTQDSYSVFYRDASIPVEEEPEVVVQTITQYVTREDGTVEQNADGTTVPETVEIATVTDENGLKITYDGVSDKDTYVSMTNHTYFNLNGETSDSILEHEMMVNADAYTRVNAEMISTGEIMDVTGTAMDFRAPKTIGRDICKDEEPLNIGGGYDHNFVLNGHKPEEAVVMLSSKESGISLDVFTDYPGIQIYSGNFLCDKKGKGGRIYPNRSGVALETQQFPDAMHHENFPSPLLKAGEKFHTETEYRFSVK
jgi:hypothetical protein